eukprot:11237947-Ditylum_brightwellii.AAC.1
MGGGRICQDPKAEPPHSAQTGQQVPPPKNLHSDHCTERARKATNTEGKHHANPNGVQHRVEWKWIVGRDGAGQPDWQRSQEGHTPAP